MAKEHELQIVIPDTKELELITVKVEKKKDKFIDYMVVKELLKKGLL